MVYRLAFARTGSKYDADEVYQEVFLRLIRKNPVFKSEEHCKAWLLRVTVNCSNTFLGSVWQMRTQGLQEEIPFETEEEADKAARRRKIPFQKKLLHFAVAVAAVFYACPEKR